MPAVTQAQQHLMGQALQVKIWKSSNGKKGLDPKEIKAEWRSKIEDLADNMSKSDLEDYAKTSNLEENETSATPASVNGMGTTSLPRVDSPGSGDIPTGLFGKPKKRKIFKSFKEFSEDLKASKKN